VFGCPFSQGQGEDSFNPNASPLDSVNGIVGSSADVRGCGSEKGWKMVATIGNR